MVHIGAETCFLSSGAVASVKPLLQSKEAEVVDAIEFGEHCKEREEPMMEVDVDGSVDPLIRTASQVEKQMQVQAVLGRLVDHQQPIRDLVEKVSQLSSRVVNEGVCLEDEKQTLGTYRKSARNYGEDLLDDTLALDKLTGLFRADRIQRKEAIASLDALLEQVDKVKSDVARLEQEVDVKLTAKNEMNQCLSVESTEIYSDGEDSMEIDHPDEDTEVSNSPVEELPLPESPSMFLRTDSQARKQIEVQNVAQRWQNESNPLQRLKDKVSRLAARTGLADAQLEEEKNVLEDCQKLARNLGEDLLEDMVSLDELSGLFPEDRSNRKAALVRMEAFLEEVDTLKSELMTLKSSLDVKLETGSAAKKELASSSVELHDKVLHSCGGVGAPSSQRVSKQLSKTLHNHRCHECGNTSSQGWMGDSGFEDQWFCSDCWRSWEASSCGELNDLPVQTCATEKLRSLELTIPDSQFWESLELPLQLTSSEDRSGYTVTSHLCNIRAEEIKLHLSHNRSDLTISAKHLPTASELKKMQDKLRQRLSQPECSSLTSQALLSLYAKIANGSFGSFSKTLALPVDVDVEHMEASCDNGLLRVRLPKCKRQPRSTFGHPFI